MQKGCKEQDQPWLRTSAGCRDASRTEGGWVQDFTEPRGPQNHPRSAAFGLPLQLGVQSRDTTLGVSGISRLGLPEGSGGEGRDVAGAAGSCWGWKHGRAARGGSRCLIRIAQTVRGLKLRLWDLSREAARAAPPSQQGSCWHWDIACVCVRSALGSFCGV